MNNTPTPKRPRDATASPITAPPLYDTDNAFARPELLAASDVRTLAFVAALIPKKPASTELTAPKINAAAVFIPSPGANIINTATMIMNTASTLYSLKRNAIAPS